MRRLITFRYLKRSACADILNAIMNAILLLFWFLEALSPRMEVIADWERAQRARSVAVVTHNVTRPVCVNNHAFACLGEEWLDD